jgi:hypothetical protein
VLVSILYAYAHQAVPLSLVHVAGHLGNTVRDSLGQCQAAYHDLPLARLASLHTMLCCQVQAVGGSTGSSVQAQTSTAPDSSCLWRRLLGVLAVMCACDRHQVSLSCSMDAGLHLLPSVLPHCGAVVCWDWTDLS